MFIDKCLKEHEEKKKLLSSLGSDIKKLQMIVLDKMQEAGTLSFSFVNDCSNYQYLSGNQTININRRVDAHGEHLVVYCSTKKEFVTGEDLFAILTKLVSE